MHGTHVTDLDRFASTVCLDREEGGKRRSFGTVGAVKILTLLMHLSTCKKNRWKRKDASIHTHTVEVGTTQPSSVLVLYDASVRRSRADPSFFPLLQRDKPTYSPTV